MNHLYEHILKLKNRKPPAHSSARLEGNTSPLLLRARARLREVTRKPLSSSRSFLWVTMSGSDERRLPSPGHPLAPHWQQCPPRHASMPSHLPLLLQLLLNRTKNSLVAVYWSMVWYKVISELQNFAQMESQALQSFFLKNKKRIGGRLGGTNLAVVAFKNKLTKKI